jgi:hypothetical protein
MKCGKVRLAATAGPDRRVAFCLSLVFLLVIALYLVVFNGLQLHRSGDLPGALADSMNIL